MNTTTTSATEFRRGPLAVLLTGIFLIVLDFFVVNVALPSVQQDLDADATALQWLVAGYALTFGGLLLVASRMADRWGRRRMFVLGTGLFVLSSAVCGFAPDVDTLLVARLVQGASAAAVAPTVLALIGDVYAGPQRVRALGAYATVMGVAAASGQLIGGLLIHLDIAGSGWRSIFLVNVPIGIAALVAAPRLLPETRVAAPRARRRREPAGGRRADRDRAAVGPGAEPGLAAVDLGDPRRCRGARRPRRPPGRRAAPFAGSPPRRPRADALRVRSAPGSSASSCCSPAWRRTSWCWRSTSRTAAASARWRRAPSSRRWRCRTWSAPATPLASWAGSVPGAASSRRRSTFGAGHALLLVAVAEIGVGGSVLWLVPGLAVGGLGMGVTLSGLVGR